MINYSDSDRPKHANIPAYITSKEMLDKQLIVFVEGDNDPYFYGSLCAAKLPEFTISYEINNTKHIPDCPGGKKGLLELFKYLNDKSWLLKNLSGKKTAFLFFLDKDIDDLLDTQLSSEHVIYTLYYDVENHIVQHGNLVEGCARAASMDPQEIQPLLADQTRWLRDAADKWKDWVVCCAFAQTCMQGQCVVNYSAPSQINTPRTGNLDEAKHAQNIALLETLSGLQSEDFHAEFHRISQIIDDFYERGEHGKVFKGKWYMFFLSDQLKHLAKTTPANITGIEQQIFRHIASTLDFRADWTEHFARPLIRLASKLLEPHNSS